MYARFLHYRSLSPSIVISGDIRGNCLATRVQLLFCANFNFVLHRFSDSLWAVFHLILQIVRARVHINNFFFSDRLQKLLRFPSDKVSK